MTTTFDRFELMDRIDGDIEFLAESVEMLDEDSDRLLEQIRQAVAARDAGALVKPAHTLKGMLSNFCAAPATEAARELEARGRENRLDGVDTLVRTAEQETGRLRSELHAFLETCRA